MLSRPDSLAMLGTPNRTVAAWALAASLVGTTLLGHGPVRPLELSQAEAAPKKPRQHKVAKGHTLGAIAGRYGITIHALCTANSISRDKVLKPGMVLWIPPKDDESGEETRDQVNGKGSKSAPKRGASKKSKDDDTDVDAADRRAVRWHEVAKGQVLGSIAKRYGVTLKALTFANHLTSRSTIKPGQELIVPAKDDTSGAKARYIKDHPKAAAPAKRGSKSDSKKDDESWKKYARKADRPGQLTLVRRDGKVLKVTTLTQKGNVRGAAKKAFREMLETRNHEEIDIEPRLIQLLTEVSDTFGGRRIRIVSGYRIRKTSKKSRHRHGRAIDFKIEGVPNTAVRDFCKTLDKVGVGYYPNSHFVHLDARARWTYWIDYSKPGQRPRYGGFWTSRSKAKGK